MKIMDLHPPKVQIFPTKVQGHPIVLSELCAVHNSKTRLNEWYFIIHFPDANSSFALDPAFKKINHKLISNNQYKNESSWF